MSLLVGILVALPELVLHGTVRKGTGQPNALTPGDFSYSVKMLFPGVHFKSPSHVGYGPTGVPPAYRISPEHALLYAFIAKGTHDKL